MKHSGTLMKDRGITFLLYFMLIHNYSSYTLEYENVYQWRSSTPSLVEIKNGFIKITA